MIIRGLFGIFSSYYIMRTMNSQAKIASNFPLVKRLAIRSLIGSFNLFCMFQAVLLIDVHTVTILKNSTSMFTMFLSYLFLDEVITKSKFFSFVVCIFGIILVVDPKIFNISVDDKEISSLEILGYCLMIIWSCGNASIKIILKKSKLNSREFRPKPQQLLLRLNIAHCRRAWHGRFGNRQ
jgi:drug/metabolite transporter (DMT)-like permease